MDPRASQIPPGTEAGHDPEAVDDHAPMPGDEGYPPDDEAGYSQGDPAVAGEPAAGGPVPGGTDFSGPVTEGPAAGDGPEGDAEGGTAGRQGSAPGHAETPGVGLFEEDVIVVATQESAGYGGLGTPEGGAPDSAFPGAAEGAAAEGAAPEGAAAEGAAMQRAAEGPDPLRGAGAQQWGEIKAMFVDDPAGSVQRASGLVEQAIESLTTSLRQRRDALAPWHEGDGAGTEQLRAALRGYQDMFERLEQMSGRAGSV